MSKPVVSPVISHCCQIIGFALLLVATSLRAQQFAEEGFRTRFSEAITITPVNTAFDIVPNGMVDLVFSASGEISFRKTDYLGYAIAGGYYPQLHRNDGLISFSVRTFISKTSVAPVGSYLDWSAVVGGSQDVANSSNLSPQPQPVFGIGIGLGSLRNSRFSSFAFQYGANARVLLVGGQPQFRASIFFGVGLLLGKEVRVN